VLERTTFTLQIFAVTEDSKATPTPSVEKMQRRKIYREEKNTKFGDGGAIEERFLHYVARHAQTACKKRPGYFGRNDRWCWGVERGADGIEEAGFRKPALQRPRFVRWLMILASKRAASENGTYLIR